MTTPASLTTVILFTDTDGRARFREEAVVLTEGTPQAMLSPLRPSSGYQLRQSPVGFRSQFHCTGATQWLFVLQGQMEIGLQDGSSRVFKAGDYFYSADTLPEGAVFDPALHGHWSRRRAAGDLVCKRLSCSTRRGARRFGVVGPAAQRGCICPDSNICTPGRPA